MKNFRFLLIAMLASMLIVGCGQSTSNEGNQEVTGEENEAQQMTATYIGLIDGHTFEVEKDGQPIAVQFSEDFYNELEPLLGGEITFQYEIDENGVYQLVDIVEIHGQ